MSTSNTKTTVIDNLVTTTHFDTSADIIDQKFKKVPVFSKLAESGSIKARVPDGTHFEIPVRYDNQDQNSQWFGRGATFGQAEKESLTRLIYYTKNFGSAIKRFWDDERKNRGKAQIINWVEELVENAHLTMVDDLATDMLTQNADPLAMDALPTIISTTPTTGTIGGLSRSSNSYLANQIKDFSGLTTGANLLDEMDRIYNLCNEWTGPGNVDMIVTTRKVYQDFERIARALQIIDTNKSERASLGFGDIMWKNVEVTWDPKVEAGKMYFLNSKTIELAYDPNYWMQMTDWKSDPNTLDRHAQIVSVLNLVCNNFQRNGVIFDITPTSS